MGMNRIARCQVIVCLNRCLYCGRRTPHEVCHLHGRFGRNRIGSVTPAVQARLNAIPDEERRQAAWGDHFTTAMSRAWRRHFAREPEVCDDPTCPQLAVDWQ